jgi:glutamate racemase
MKIGFFDSGLGGLYMMKEVMDSFKGHDFIYLGDSKHLPYGDKTPEEIYTYTKEGVTYLLNKGADIVVIACNSASTHTKMTGFYREFEKKFPNKKIINIVHPTVLGAKKYSRVGIIATQATIRSHVFRSEFKLSKWKGKLFEKGAPKLVPMIESGNYKNIDKVLGAYINPLVKNKINALVLGCTHYPILKNEIKNILPQKIKIISQEEIIKNVLKNNVKEIKNRNSKIEIFLTKITPEINKKIKEWFGKNLKAKSTSI